MQHYNKLLLFLPLTLLCDTNLTQHVKELESRLSELEEQKKNHKGVINLSSMETTMILGGRVTLDTIYLHNASGKEGGSNSSDQFFNANNIPLSNEGEESELTLTARNSKFWIKTRTLPENGKPFLTLLEIDFWGSNGNEQNSNSHNPRLRHAYFTYNGWTLGQTNSLFTSSIKPSTLKLPVDDVFMRQPLISYETNLIEEKIAFSFEQPESLIMTSTGTKVRVNDDQLPDIAMKYHAHHNWGEYSLSFLARQLRVDQEFDSKITDSTWGYGMNFNTKVNTFKHDHITWGIVGGKGVGRYLGTAFFPGAVITPKGELKPQTSWGSHIGYEHWINKELQFNTALGYLKTNPILTLESIDESAYSAHMAIRYNPVKNFLLSGELVHAKRILQGGDSSDIDRVYFQASYNF
ncbi:MAG: hypothetical protein K0U38_00520 [Epsilonproteobacteria bacterium]|nr:hypothetical protein [Campylobacterota bacterium]